MSILHKSKQLKKELGFFNVYAIATGATIASGFFLLPGLAAAQAGPAVVLSYLIAAFPVIPAIFSMAELSTAMPRAGGIYYFLDRSMGPFWGTLGGVGTWLALILKAAFALIGIGAYLSVFLPQIPLLPLTAGFAFFFGLLNLLGAKKTGTFQAFLVLGLLVLLIWFVGTGLPVIRLDRFLGFFDREFRTILGTAGMVFVSYIGLTQIASVSEEVKNPERNIPRGMLAAFGTALFVYLVGTFIMVGALPSAELAGDLTPVATTAGVTVGRWGMIVVSVAAILAFFSVANAGILSASRYPLGMSRDHLMPRFFRNLTGQKVPRNSIFITVVLILVVLFFLNPVKIAKLASVFQLFLFALSSLAVIIMRESRIDSYDPGFRSPFYPWIQVFGILASFWLIVEMGWTPVLFTLGLTAVGSGWYFYYGRKRVVRSGAIYHIFSRLGERRFDGLDRELRGILKEKGVRERDPYDIVIARAPVIDFHQPLNFDEVVRQAATKLAETLKVNRHIFEEGFMEGTRVGATPVSHGAALPHLRLPDIHHPELIIVRSSAGVKVDVDDECLGEHASPFPVHAFFFLVSPEEDPGQHLRILAQIASHVDDESFINRWLSAEDSHDLKEILLRDDRYLILTLRSGEKSAVLSGRLVSELHLPKGCLIALIHRKGETIIPTGDTRLEEEDSLTIIGYPEVIKDLYLLYAEE
ncbi:MAG: amino acid permease [Candidatus Aminicenantales bacterium]